MIRCAGQGRRRLLAWYWWLLLGLFSWALAQEMSDTGAVDYSAFPAALDRAQRQVQTNAAAVQAAVAQCPCARLWAAAAAFFPVTGDARALEQVVGAVLFDEIFRRDALDDFFDQAAIAGADVTQSTLGLPQILPRTAQEANQALANLSLLEIGQRLAADAAFAIAQVPFVLDLKLRSANSLLGSVALYHGSQSIDDRTRQILSAENLSMIRQLLGG
ncbi:MAG: hypothetical protein HY335_09265 [Deinococcus sp.]|nr:hypothetical protein [Deinococcus sp.]